MLTTTHAGQLYRIRIYTEEKAKVVAATWGTELLVALLFVTQTI